MTIEEFSEKFEVREKQVDDSLKYEFSVFLKENNKEVFTISLNIPVSTLYDIMQFYPIDKEKFILDAKLSARKAIYANFNVKY